eukprot:CAMPEP_0194193830 /NCGR_PEP_ID=MMETSP0154-20130528/75251_1 /TAXON_ID=1049557 /ORGANISM="Thalassiothrix antarctica, Strain L6-D1" /LENGTH=185 /DNA_ID=CAMNT_0038918203 /DNA_START=196 /DNA_END=750 /DNA_ORIENTATION=-
MKDCCSACSDDIDSFATCVTQAEKFNLVDGSEDDSDNIVETVFVDDSKADDSKADDLAAGSDLIAAGLSGFNEALCSNSTLFQTSMEDFVSTAALVGGETILKCASDAATLTTCIICNECTNCNEKFHQLKEDQNGSCDEQSELFRYCGCDACEKEVKAMLDCHCSAENFNLVDGSEDDSDNIVE